jgi:hypothetical protein
MPDKTVTLSTKPPRAAEILDIPEGGKLAMLEDGRLMVVSPLTPPKIITIHHGASWPAVTIETLSPNFSIEISIGATPRERG